MQHPNVAALICTATDMLSVNDSTAQPNNWPFLDLFGKQALHIKGLYRPGSRAHRTVEILQRYGKQVGSPALPVRVDCCFCQEQVINPIVTPCNHIWCRECISTWLVGSVECPGCHPDLMLAKADIPVSSASPARFSSSQLTVPLGTKPAQTDNPTKQGVGPDPEDLSRRLEEVLKQFPDLKAYPIPMQPVPVSARNASRTWCIQRRTPLRNRAAHPLIQLDLEPSTPRAQSSLSYRLDTPSSPMSFASQRVPQLTFNQDGSCPLTRARPPQLKPYTPTETNISQSPPSLTRVSTRTSESQACAPTPPSKSKHRRLRSLSLFLRSSQLHPIQTHPTTPPSPNITTITSHIMLANMSQTSSLIASEPQISVRCKAAAKCVWREWREVFLDNEGKQFYTETLLEALRRSFERTVVEYGWAEDWRELPPVFVDRMARARWDVVFGRREVLGLLGRVHDDTG